MLYTSYFAYFSKKEKPNNLISIATKTPEWFGAVDTYPKLFPGWDIVNFYKKSFNQLKTQQAAQVESSLKELQNWYIETYYSKVLSKLDPYEVLNDLNHKIILCYEKPGDFCHRYIVASWLFINTGIKTKEL